MIDINKLKLTDMGNPELIPQLVEEVATKFIKEEEKIICEKLFDLDIDKDILINQTQEINRLNDILREYKELEEQGLLLKLPCKVGDTVYSITRDFISEYNIRNFICYDNGNIFFDWKCVKGIYLNIKGFHIDDIGKDIFLTKEEAEQALKRLESAE